MSSVFFRETASGFIMRGNKSSKLSF